MIRHDDTLEVSLSLSREDAACVERLAEREQVTAREAVMRLVRATPIIPPPPRRRS